MSYKETGRCSINPKHTYTHWGNNAEPVNSGRCCDDCNNRVVLVTRIYGAQMSAMMSQLGSKKSEAKKKAAQENGKKGGRPSARKIANDLKSIAEDKRLGIKS